MRVLLMRPQAEAKESARRLLQMGHLPILAPLMTVAAIETKLPGGRFDAIIVTSANAVSSLPAGPLPRALAETKVFAVGDRTAAAARERGFRSVLSARGDAAALSAVVEERIGPGARVLYLAGRSRKPTIEAAIGPSATELVTVEIYEMHPASGLPPEAAAALEQRRLDAALHYSRRSCAAFCDLVARAGLADAAAGLAHHCISADAAEPLAAIGAGRIIVAPEPSEPALLATLPPCRPHTSRV